MGTDRVLMDMKTQPDVVLEAVQKCTDYTCQLSELFFNEGACDALCIDNLWSNNVIMKLHKYPPFPQPRMNAVIEKRAVRDIEETGIIPIEIVEDIGVTLEVPVEGCLQCKRCKEECPEHALVTVEKEGDYFISCSTQDCLGTSCRRCARTCPVKAIDFKNVVPLNVNVIQKDNMTGGVY